MTFLEKALFEFLEKKTKNGRITIRIAEIANALSESKGMTYRALVNLKEKKKISYESRGKKGIEVEISDKLKNSNSPNIPESKEYEKSENNKKITDIRIKEIIDFINNLSSVEKDLIKKLL